MSMLPVGIGSAEAGGFQIERSLRFNSADSAYLNRTPGSAGNRRTWTWSGWVKRSALGSQTFLFNADNGSANSVAIDFFNEQLRIYFVGGTYQVATTQVFRDPSAWYHLLFSVDTTQATSSNRVKLYVNGSQVTALSTASYPIQNLDTAVNNTVVHNLGFNGVSNYFNGYLTEINFIDGQALTPSSFGETDTDTGVWKPKAYSGSYGTNGFYLKFADNSGTTSTTLGKDSSGNGNNWTPNNFSVTAGAGNDSLVDTPTNYGTDTGVGGEVRGNYCTWNPIANSAGSLTDGNLRLNGTSSPFTRCNSTIGVSSGKWYFESTLTTASTNTTIGIGQNNLTSQYPGQDALSYAFDLETGRSLNNNVQPSYGVSLTSGDVFQVAFDLDNNKLFFGKNGTWMASSDPATGVNPVYTLSAGTYNAIARPYNTGSVINTNFGQRPFAYTAPSGFKALCTQNLPEPTIADGGDYFNTILYTGTGSSNARTGVGFQPDFVWIKGRSGATDHGLYDAVRGVQKQLETNNTGAETTETTGLTAFGSDGFTVGALAQLNTSSATYVAWNWKANGAGSTNTAGTITSTVSVNTTSGFSIVTYTGTGSAGTVGHGLGVTPQMFVIKARSAATGWPMYHAFANASPATGYMALHTTDAFFTSAAFNNTAPTSTVFSINGTGYAVNNSSVTYVCYAFAPIAGYSAFGSYTGNGSSTDGPFVYTGFRPRWVLIKGAAGSFDTGAFSWIIYDTKRDTYNLAGLQLRPNLSNAEISDFAYNNIDILSNGFKMRGGNYGELNGSGNTYIYAAFAENPFKYSLAR